MDGNSIANVSSLTDPSVILESQNAARAMMVELRPFFGAPKDCRRDGSSLDLGFNCAGFADDWASNDWLRLTGCESDDWLCWTTPPLE